MNWEYIFISFFVGIFMGIILMYYKNRNLLNNQKIMYKELENNKKKLNEYQQELNQHFTYSIDLLNNMADNYRRLYHNIKKSANFFLPNIHIPENSYTLHSNTNNANNEKLSIEVPRDYSDNIESTIIKK